MKIEDATNPEQGSRCAFRLPASKRMWACPSKLKRNSRTRLKEGLDLDGDGEVDIEHDRHGPIGCRPRSRTVS